MSSPVLFAEGLRKRFGGYYALDGFDLSVPAGTVCGLLGPNGAGKTTVLRILSTLMRPDGGRATVAGYDVTRQAAEVRNNIGMIGQQSTVDDILTGRENLALWGRLYHLSAANAKRRADELLEQFGLNAAASKQVKYYSGGMRRRLDLASSFITAPRVMFLDEPTAGLDPRNRIEMWSAVRALAQAGTTVLLTTQLLDEADQLADQIVLMDGGREIASGTPDELKARTGGDWIDVTVRNIAQLPAAAGVMARAAGGKLQTAAGEHRISAAVADRAHALTDVTRALHDAGIDAEDVTLRRATLDEVFLLLTGKDAEEVEAV
ncbi:ATP-binding cassette domain-containing protein [Umezawaea tangerina]|uniref:ABC-2 type transport system ATP-binding protein n=1 Tax=Umezawaea tangerina TaxID=84725 RepID=A0A2T0SA69_9PSEU|nr:ATP-binding cassette domain-containing protein [Umezawaea tangerina]PRY30316.1 ABC-2 type transport system ATP-binding protein [Umezawaea tangerina]